MHIKFSVLIPVYNVEKYLIDCIESVLQQTYQNFEIILIDDGSIDLSGKICAKYVEKDSRIKLYHQKNQGVLISRLNAIAKASGNFYLFLDSDDFWDNNLLETVYQTIYEYDCDMVIYKFTIFSIEGVQISVGIFDNLTIFDNNNKEKLFQKIINNSTLNSLCIKAIKNTILDITDYSQYENIKNAEDLLQSIPLLYKAEKIIYLDKSLYNYRDHSGSNSKTFNINMYQDITIVRSMVLEYMIKLKIDNNTNLKLFYEFYFNFILNYISTLINSNVSKSNKISVMLKIQNIKLYLESLEFLKYYNLSLIQKIRHFLFKYKLFIFLKLYESFINFLNKMR